MKIVIIGQNVLLSLIPQQNNCCFVVVKEICAIKTLHGIQSLLRHRYVRQTIYIFRVYLLKETLQALKAFAFGDCY